MTPTDRLLAALDELDERRFAAEARSKIVGTTMDTAESINADNGTEHTPDDAERLNDA